MKKNTKISLTIVSLLVACTTTFAERIVAEWSFNQQTSSKSPSVDNTFGPSAANTVDQLAVVNGGFIGLASFGAAGKTIGSPGDTSEAPEIGGVANNNAMGLSGSRSVLDTAGTASPSGSRALTIIASTLYYTGGVTVSFHASHSYLGSRYYQILATSDGIEYLPVSGGTGSFSGDSLGINGQLSTSVSVSDDGIITWITSEGVEPSLSNGDAFVYEISYTFPEGSVYENNPNFGFKVAEIYDPAGSDYVSSFAGTVFGQTNGFQRKSTYFDVVRITAGTGPATWAGYVKDSNEGFVDTGEWLGWINVSGGDWVWVYDLGSYMYLPESLVTSNGAWTYILR